MKCPKCKNNNVESVILHENGGVFTRHLCHNCGHSWLSGTGDSLNPVKKFLRFIFYFIVIWLIIMIFLIKGCYDDQKERGVVSSGYRQEMYL